MWLSEYKSKELLTQYGVTVPPGRLARSPTDAEDACARVPAKKYVVKAQIAAGGRGLAGGIRFAATPSSVHDEAANLIGSTLVTPQTGAGGEVVRTVYVEAALDLKAQRYVALTLDPRTGRIAVLAAAEGGVEFEKAAHARPDMVKVILLDDPVDRDALAADLATAGIEGGDAVDLILSARQAFVDCDMTLLEINPFARLEDGSWIAIDAKVALDPGAAFRHPEFESILADQGLSEGESQAQRSNINLVTLDGNLGVVVNGAGLGLATNDMIRDAGGHPANFMDIRTTATSFDIARGVELLLKDAGVAAILLNVHGGGMTVCDTVAEGVAFAYSRATRKPPVVARLAGQNAEWGLRILRDRKVPVEVWTDMRPAIRRAVELAGGAR